MRGFSLPLLTTRVLLGQFTRAGAMANSTHRRDAAITPLEWSDCTDTSIPMQLLGWLIRLAFFAVVLWFALKNTTPVPLRLTETFGWDGVPLILIILGCLVVGVLAGAAALAPKVFRLRRQVAALSNQASRAKVAEAAAERYNDRLANAARNAGAVGQLDADTQFPR